ncbi:Maf family protein [Brucepastera parasyntrophica]|uniref:Maf family protein n=1 Tax=Brucepastera parasyntrophica TaxID=2880008 RepID=UPI002108AABC|nr:Maf family protein [Brucepastera parasyntrophica]ULQ59966.1 Maf family protein [Brucepastera parasyntrophica]
MEPIILASTSPRRQDILRSLNIPFTVMNPPYVETVIEGMSPPEYAEFNAIKKLESVMRMELKITIKWILAADTIISFNGKICGKPKDRDEAGQMLRMYSGATHEVITALCFYSSDTHYTSTRISTNKVSFMELEDSQIENYLDTGEWQGVAGAYRVQGLASCFISKIEGSYTGIVGLPIHDFYAILREQSYPFII